MNCDQNITACMIPGDTLEEIERNLNKEKFRFIKKLMQIYQCNVGDLAHKIARTKGIKCSKRILSQDTISEHKLSKKSLKGGKNSLIQESLFC